MRLGEKFPVVIVSEAFIACQGKLLLFHRSVESRRWPNVLMAPGGHVDLKEDVLSSVIREVREETGVRLPRKNTRLKVVAVHHHRDRDETFLIFVFVSRLPKIQKLAKINEEGQAQWLEIAKVKENPNLFPIVRNYLKAVLSNDSRLLFTSADCQKSQICKIHSWISN